LKSVAVLKDHDEMLGWWDVLIGSLALSSYCLFDKNFGRNLRELDKVEIEMILEVE